MSLNSTRSPRKYGERNKTSHGRNERHPCAHRRERSRAPGAAVSRFPESWYSWRHQMQALAEAGFHAIAPDMRGYGQTDRPEQIDRYTLLHLVGDVVGLLDALGTETAVIVGHDWGAPVAWYAALLRPDRFRGVIGLSVPFRPRSPVRPTSIMRQTEDAQFFQLYFQSPGIAEAELERDVRVSIRSFLYSASGKAGMTLQGTAAKSIGYRAEVAFSRA